ncbi:unnamed protein product [Allacma fusca]|uniref:RecQ-mediated genome instability protein 1 n=1 Tax=Allacma fusca TaxID=39272 RepID=A0A8J2KK44_9HEXA|nr:unnamed protein product [Allacma fusca]
MESAARTVKNILLRERHLNFSDEWFDACIDWIKENHPPSQVNVTFLRDEVCNQWMDVNLMDLGCKCLPDDLCSQKCVTLPGHYALQVNIIEDIGESSYSQWNKLKKLTNENTNVSGGETNESKPTWEPKPRRCLYLTMSDGSQEVFGLELVTVPALNVDVKTGSKVLISGPIECRRGVLHLKPGNVRILGGEVEALVEANAFEQVLQKRL